VAQVVVRVLRSASRAVAATALVFSLGKNAARGILLPFPLELCPTWRVLRVPMRKLIRITIFLLWSLVAGSGLQGVRVAAQQRGTSRSQHEPPSVGQRAPDIAVSINLGKLIEFLQRGPVLSQQGQELRSDALRSLSGNRLSSSKEAASAAVRL